MHAYTDVNEFNTLMDRIEQLPKQFPIAIADLKQLELNCLISQAISLKRIADALEKLAKAYTGVVKNEQ